MKPFTKHEGLVAPLDRANVDTDAIIPKQFLKSIKRSGFGPNAFDEWRYLDQGEPGLHKEHQEPCQDEPEDVCSGCQELKLIVHERDLPFDSLTSS